MVSKRAKRFRRRRRASIKPLLRRLQSAVSRLPMQARVPPDPPSINGDIVFNTILMINVASSFDTATGFQNYGSAGHTALYFLKVGSAGTPALYGLNPGQITISDLQNMLGARIGLTFPKSASFEVCVRKVQLWGSNRRQVTISGAIDLGPFTAHRAAQDVGSSSRRPRIGFSVPYDEWVSTDTSIELPFFTFDLDSTTGVYEPKDAFVEGELVGTIYLTVGVRYGWLAHSSWSWPWKSSSLVMSKAADTISATTTAKPKTG